jgi:hypothetical protein
MLQLGLILTIHHLYSSRLPVGMGLGPGKPEGLIGPNYVTAQYISKAGRNALDTLPSLVYVRTQANVACTAGGRGGYMHAAAVCFRM